MILNLLLIMKVLIFFVNLFHIFKFFLNKLLILFIDQLSFKRNIEFTFFNYYNSFANTAINYTFFYNIHMNRNLIKK